MGIDVRDTLVLCSSWVQSAESGLNLTVPARMVGEGDVVRAWGGKLGGGASKPGGAIFGRLLIDPATAMGDEGPIRRGNAAAPGAGRHPQPALVVRVRGVDRGEVLA